MSETQRIELLVRRDGVREARAWVERTLKLYREAIASRGSHAATGEYRPRFEQSVRDFEDWLQGSTTGPSIPPSESSATRLRDKPAHAQEDADQEPL
ncbi:MAG: hypothetical protein ACT4P3_16450 [Betaproteobacteria bacterium]